MIIVCVRTIILYIVVLIAVRIMGKSELSKMSPFQMVIIFMIAELASISIDSTDTSLANAVIAIFSLLFLQVLISYISIKSEGFKNFVNGKPGIVIDKGRLNLKEMSRLRLSINDLIEQLRIEKCPSISDAEYAILESNGSMTVIMKSENNPVTNKTMGFDVTQEVLSLILLNDGVLYENNLEKIDMSLDDLFGLLRAKGIEDIDDVFIAFSDSNRNIHVFCKPDGSCSGIDAGSDKNSHGSNQQYAREVN